MTLTTVRRAAGLAALTLPFALACGGGGKNADGAGGAGGMGGVAGGAGGASGGAPGGSGGVGAVGGAPPEYGVCTIDDWCWDFPPPQGNELNDAWASDINSDVWVVGNRGTVIHHDGINWMGIPVPTTEDLHGVWGAAPDDIWAVGDDATVLHYDGSGWTVVNVVAAPVDGGVVNRPDFHAIEGIGANDIVLAGESAIYKFDGTDWVEQVTMSGAPVSRRALFDVYAAPNGEYWVSGVRGEIAHFDGMMWEIQPTGFNATLDSVDGTGPTDVWAFTSATNSFLRYDGMTWNQSVTPTSLRPATVHAASVTAADQVFIWGPNGEAARFDGMEWTPLNTGVENSFNGAWTVGPGQVLAVGQRGMMLYWDGDGRSVVAPGAVANRLSVSGVPGTDPWAVGDEIRRYDGLGWLPEAKATFRSLYGVWMVNENLAWAVGTQGTVERYGGSTVGWEQVEVPTTEWLRSVWLTEDGSAGFIVGMNGTILTLLNQTTWIEIDSGTSRDLIDVWGVAADDAWAVGAGGLALRWNGAAWTEVPSGTTVDLRGIWGTASDDIYAVGQLGTVLRWSGTAWNEELSGEPFSLNDVSGTSPSDIWAVGTGGTILQYDGSSWIPQESGVSFQLNGVYAADAANAWAVGENGSILKYSP